MGERPALAELAAETLMQKHVRLMRERCRHPADAVVSSSFHSPDCSFTDEFCLDCGKLTRVDHGK
jgi:hypothetical protein